MGKYTNATQRFPERRFLWYNNFYGPFETAELCAQEYDRAYAAGESYRPPPGVPYSKFEYGKREPNPIPTLNLSSKSGKCETCVDSRYPCPKCYTVWWEQKYPTKGNDCAVRNQE